MRVSCEQLFLRKIILSQYKKGMLKTRSGTLSDFIRELAGSRASCFRFLKKMIALGILVHYKTSKRYDEADLLRNDYRVKKRNAVLFDVELNYYFVDEAKVLNYLEDNDELFRLDNQILESIATLKIDPTKGKKG